MSGETEIGGDAMAAAIYEKPPLIKVNMAVTISLRKLLTIHR